MNLDVFLADEVFHEWMRIRLDDEAGLEATWQMLRAKRGCHR